MLSGLLPTAAQEPGVAAQIRRLTGRPTRIVWCQDTGDGADTVAESSHLLLMGLDTEDGRGERAILAAPCNYAKPLLTPSGDQVVFFNRHEETSYAVNWDGSGRRALAYGFALAVWEDPGTGQAWVYIGQPAADFTAVNTAVRNVRRHRLDLPEISEPAWNRTPVNLDNFQLSADGRRASAPLPWPECGLLDLPEGAATKLGDGCWPSLAPDNSYLFWLFDGAHRNLTFFEYGTGRRWVVNINRAPGLGGFEVYHPRWSNHHRFLVMTGPYTAGSGDNRILAGGTGVEIYLGRFSPDHRQVEQWVRVTHNQRGDFCPDAWISGGRAAGVAAPPATIKPAAAAASDRGKIARLVLSARPVELSRLPAPAAIAPYRRALVVNRYRVEHVLEGHCTARQVMAAHWAIRDAQVLPGAARQTNQVYRLVLEPFDAHPELEGERLIMDSDEFNLPLYYELAPADAVLLRPAD